MTTEPGRVLLKDRAYSHIKGLILGGTYEPGRFISERELAVELGMSKTPIRSALERLSEQGFVQIAPQRGVIVRDLSHREVADHYDFRAAIESWIVRHLAGRLTAEQIGELKANLALQRTLVDEEFEIKTWTAADTEFHMLMTTYTGNAQFIQAMRHQREKVSRVVQSIAFRDPSVPRRSCQEHEAIFEAVLAGEGERAAQLLEQHLEHGKRFLLLGGVYGA